jgi:hypothetical protein
MYRNNSEDTAMYKVVVNHQEQYSIWLDEQKIPLGWKDTGKVVSSKNVSIISPKCGRICDRLVYDRKCKNLLSRFNIFVKLCPFIKDHYTSRLQ